MNKPTQRDVINSVANILITQGEGLLNIDMDGVDPKVAYELATEITNDVAGTVDSEILKNWKFNIEIDLCEECREQPAEVSTYDEKNICLDCLERIDRVRRKELWTKVITTNPSGHVVSMWSAKLTPEQVANRYTEYYATVLIVSDPDATPPAIFLECYPKGINPQKELYQIIWSNE